MNKKVIGITTGVFDLFHIGHLNVIKKAKENCDYLIVAVSRDELVKQYKNKTPIIKEDERLEIVSSIKYVDKAIYQEDMDKLNLVNSNDADLLFVGSDWKGTEKWNKIEADLDDVNKKVVYFEYTNTTSSTLIREVLYKENQRMR